jgi:hypothetical protein
MTASEDPVLFVVPGDLHLTLPELENHRVALRVIDEVNQLIRPAFVQFIGDNVQDATGGQFLLFNDLRERVSAPHFVLVGDHDVHQDPGAEGFLAHVGPTYGASSLRGFRFIRLNTQEARPVGISPEQIVWFRGQVDEARTLGERVIIFQHNYPYQIWEDFDGPGLDDWRTIVQGRGITAIVTGHMHYFQVANDGRNVTIAVRSIGDPEGGDPGYLIGYAQGDDFATVYRAVHERGPIVLITHPRESLMATGPRHVVRGRDRVEFRLWSAFSVRSAHYRIDASDWRGLEPSEGGPWTGPIIGDRLSRGEHTLEVRAIDERGDDGRQRIGFMVDQTARYTAVPNVRPFVAETAFC